MTATFFNNLKFTQRILMYLLPFALVLGPFFSDLFAIFVSIIFIILSIKEKKWHYYKHPLIIIFWTWCIYLILLSILSQNPTLSLESSLFHWRFGFFAIAVWYIIDNDSKFVKNFVLSLCLVFVGVLLDSYIQFFTGYNILNGERKAIEFTFIIVLINFKESKIIIDKSNKNTSKMLQKAEYKSECS